MWYRRLDGYDSNMQKICSFIFYLSKNFGIESKTVLKWSTDLEFPGCSVSKIFWSVSIHGFHFSFSKNHTPLFRFSFFTLVFRSIIKVSLFRIVFMLYWTYSSSLFFLLVGAFPDLKCTFQPQLPCFFFKSTRSI